ncbi:MAG: glycosyl transferase family protein [Microgenomates group bacterium Gr01-1014_16]|nr:MAG: glycosyl transferase family protein [Microgenomates group bacterium Gr01-1014_16]
MTPGITVIIPIYNSERTIAKCLDGLVLQDYPRSRLDVLILDGGSTDESIRIIKSYLKKLNLRVIHAGFKDNMEGRRIIGYQRAKFGFICVLDSDNYLLSPDWMSRMVKPLLENPSIVSSFTLHYQYLSTQTPFNRYVALFGGHDPVSYYLKKTDRLKWTDNNWTRPWQIVSQQPGYTVVHFTAADFPTLGSNGAIIRKKFIKYRNIPIESFFHTDILYDALTDGHDLHAVVDVPVVHDTGSTIINNIKKRVEYMSLHHQKLSKHRRYLVFNSRSESDVFNLIKFIVYTVTIVRPLSESLAGYIKIRDIAWFLHPIACWLFLLGYGYAVITNNIK